MKSEIDYLREAIRVSEESVTMGNHPFGAILVDSDGNILLTAVNTVNTGQDCTGHAETNLVRDASKKYSRDFLGSCTLYTSAEPCAMCSGAIYWSGIGAVTYALSESALFKLTGDDPENPTLQLPCRKVFACGQRKVKISGPHIEEEACKPHIGFWHPES